MIKELKALNSDQRAAFTGAFLGWTLDAFDFFILVFVVKAIASDFHTRIEDVTVAIMLTLMFRPLGALVFGWLADRFGRRPVLMVDVLLFSGFELASAFAPSLTALLILRALFGFAMGGEWGIGSSLVMESVPQASRGMISGIFQQGYAMGYLLAAVVFGLLYNHIGWRGMFVVGTLPALLVLYIRRNVKESPAWEQGRHRQRVPDLLATVRNHWKLVLYVVVLMTAFNFLSHGTQDMYPTFLQVQHKFSTNTVSLIAIVANVGAIIGGTITGALSQRLGRRRAIVLAALLVLPVIPLWAFSTTPLLLGLGAFLIQIAVQGAWGVVPAHLNELSPPEARGTFTGFTYQLGNMIAASNAPLQAYIAHHHNGNFALALACVTVTAALAIVVLALVGREARDRVLA